MERRQRGIAGIAGSGRPQRQPVDAVGHHLGFRQPVAHGLESGERPPELLALAGIGRHALESSTQQARSLGSQRHPPGAADLIGADVMAANLGGNVRQVGHRIGIEHFVTGSAHLRLARGKARHAAVPDDHHRGARLQEAHRLSQLPLFHQAQRARQVGIDQRAYQGGRSRFHRERQPGQLFHHQRRRHRAEFGHGHDIKEPALGQRRVQFIAGERKGRVVHRHRGEGARQTVQKVEDLDLVFVERKLHQRGSRGNCSTSLAMMLSWISAAPAAMPATIPRWWCIWR